MDPNLRAEVLEVSHEWNFVVLNVGTKDAVSNNREFILTRGDQFVARVRVTRVSRDFCIADVRPEPVPKSSVSVGDVAILPISM
jgi:hypothetical protein